MKVHKRIKEARESLGQTQKQLADNAKITYAAISQIESGERTPSTPVLLRISKVLNVSTDFLLGVTDSVDLKDILNDKDVLKFFKAYQDLKPDDKFIIKQQIEFLSSRN